MLHPVHRHDQGTKFLFGKVLDLINQQKAKGVAVIYVGEDLDVLLELSDRILVLCGGKVSGIVPGRGATKRDVGMMMTKLGGNKADE